MKRFYQMCVALVLCVLGATTATAGEMVSLQKARFGVYDGWGKDAVLKSKADCAWAIDTPSGQPYGDPSVNNRADLSSYTKLVIVAKDGTPRIMMNRGKVEGQYNDNEAESFLIEYPKCENGWAAKYFSKVANEDGTTTYTVDLKKMYEDKGFCHLHAIKGANWNNVTVLSMELEKAPAKGWTKLIENGSFEWDDFDSFPVVTLGGVKEDGVEVQPGTIAPKIWASEEDNLERALVKNGTGNNSSRALMLTTMAGAPEGWTTQLFVKFSEPLPEGTQYKFSMDVKSEPDATGIGSGSHAAPRSYIGGGVIPAFDASADWTTVTAEGTVSKDFGDKGFQSIAFDLNKDQTNATTFYFDNINFEIYKVSTEAKAYGNAILIDFGFNTNIPELVKAANKPRIIYPSSCVNVTMNGNSINNLVYSVEAFEDGRFFIFLSKSLTAKQVSQLSIEFTNPNDENLQLIYRSGSNKDEVIADFQGVIPTYDASINKDQAFPWDCVKPSIAVADPEDGSFQLANDLKVFNIIFDKATQVSKLTATLGNETLNVAATDAEGDYATAFVLTREGADLANGEYILSVKNAIPKFPIGEVGNYDLTLNFGPVKEDPNDKEETVYVANFTNGGEDANGEGWMVNSGGTMQPAASGGGCRLITGGASAGNGFTPSILYLGARADGINGVAFYGANEDKKLTLKAKKYHLTLGAARWDGGTNARTLKVQVLADGAVNTEDGSVIDDSKIIAEETQAIVPEYKNSTGVTRFDVAVPVTEEGNYIIRLVTGNADGSPATWNDASAIGDIKVEYLPNTVGLEWVKLLKNALEDAKKILAKYADESFAGDAQTNLSEAIASYEENMSSYTAPSAFQTAADDLAELSKALEDHGKLCGDYETAIKAGLDVVRQCGAELDNGKPNAKYKFSKTQQYQDLCEVMTHYNATSEWRDVNEDPEGEPNMQLFYDYNKLTDDTELTEAIAELNGIVNLTSILFTTGESQAADYGIKVLFERTRLGIAGLKALGVAEDDALLVEANQAVTDDDEITGKLMARTTEEVYAKLKGEENIFEKVEIDDSDPENPVETKTPLQYEMTVFVKNPNTYVLQFANGLNEENVPGWTTSGATGMWIGWNGYIGKETEGVAEDIAFSIYHNNGSYEQTITNLPVGVYTVMIDAARWDNPRYEKDQEYTIDGVKRKLEEGDPLIGQWRQDVPECNSFAYIKTTENPEGAKETLDYYGLYQMHHENKFENVVIMDGQLTLGVNFASDNGQYFSDKVKLYLTGKAEGFDYGKAYDDATGIEIVEVNNKAQNGAIYNLAGQKVNKSFKGLVIKSGKKFVVK